MRQMRMNYLIAAFLTLTSSTSARIAIKFYIDSTHTHTHTRITSRLLLCLLNCCAFNTWNCSQTSHKIHTENICSFPASVCVCVSLLPKLISCQYCLQIHIHRHTHISLYMCVCLYVSLSAKFKSISSLISYQFLHVVLLWPVQLPPHLPSGCTA